MNENHLSPGVGARKRKQDLRQEQSYGDLGTLWVMGCGYWTFKKSGLTLCLTSILASSVLLARNCLSRGLPPSLSFPAALHSSWCMRYSSLFHIRADIIETMLSLGQESTKTL